jgi:AcrR family transcriptional regulator
MIAADPGASIASIAAEAGVDRRTIYRRFASREELLAAIYAARLTAIEQAIEDARLREAPVDLARMLADDTVHARRDAYIREVDAFLQRATDEGLLRPKLPEGWASALLPQLMHLVSRQMPHLSPAQAADVVVDTLLHGIGTS